MRDETSSLVKQDETPENSARHRPGPRFFPPGGSVAGKCRTRYPRLGDALPATDLRPEQLVRPHGIAAFLTVHDGERGEGRAARTAPAEELAATLRASVRQLFLELLEPATRRAAAETEGHPVPEDLPTLLPQPVRSLRHALTLAAWPPRSRGVAARRRRRELPARPRRRDGALLLGSRSGLLGRRRHVSPGGNYAGLWNARMPLLLRFFARACA